MRKLKTDLNYWEPISNELKAMAKIFNVEVAGITDDSRKVKKGFLFVAVKGSGVDGHDFINEAVAKGAAAIVGEKNLKLPGVKYFKVTDTREALGKLASDYYGNPSRKLKIIGVTGTKGKTTTTHLIYHILKSAGKKVGLISSVVAKIGDKEADTGFHVTTPDVISLHKFLKEMVEAGLEYAVLEVSSHGITQKRIAGVNFEIAVLTNIAPEHIDYHKTFSEYKKTKLSFLASARKKILSAKKTSINLFPGDFNNLNAQTAVNVVKLLGIAENEAIASLNFFELPEGRMEEVKVGQDFRVFIDFAHTPDSLEAALTYLKSIAKGRLLSVFGAAGERDPRKREKMGEISSKIADLSIFTAEDPRTESVHDIVKTMSKGAKNFVLIPERGEAIAFALSCANTGDVVGFFGKGHEKSMAYQDFEHPWNEREIIQFQLSSKYKNTSVIVLAAGMGKRMKSPFPKVMREVCGRPMLSYTLENLRRIGIKDIALVVNFKKSLVEKQFTGSVKFAFQNTPKGGTADATMAGLAEISSKAKTVVVINGDDSAFYKPGTIEDVILSHKKSKSTVSFVSLERENPKGLGRVRRNNKGEIEGIIEEKDATDEERKIKEVNDGLYVFEREWLTENLGKIEKSPVSGEYYLVNTVKIALSQGRKVSVYKLKDSSEWRGVNTPEELIRAEAKMKKRLNAFAKN